MRRAQVADLNLHALELAHVGRIQARRLPGTDRLGHQGLHFVLRDHGRLPAPGQPTGEQLERRVAITLQARAHGVALGGGRVREVLAIDSPAAVDVGIQQRPRFAFGL